MRVFVCEPRTYGTLSRLVAAHRNPCWALNDDPLAHSHASGPFSLVSCIVQTLGRITDDQQKALPSAVSLSRHTSQGQTGTVNRQSANTMERTTINASPCKPRCAQHGRQYTAHV